jgi:hypothetical protein
MNQTTAKFPQLAYIAAHLTINTNKRLGNALVHALRSRAHASSRQLDIAVADASRELRANGLDDPRILAFLGDVVEDTGRACGADRPSLLTGELRWAPVHRRVLESARSALSTSVLPALDQGSGAN